MWSPLGSDDIHPTARWEPEPHTRGPFSILSTCLITLSLCIWTCLHLNIPEHGKADRQFWRKLKWLMVGLLAPEMVLLVAYKQWRAQKKLTKDMAGAFGNLSPKPTKPRISVITRLSRLFKSARKEDLASEILGPVNPARADTGLPDPQRRRFAWTATHSFYAIMGGFACENSKDHKDFVPFPDRRERMTLNVDGLVLLAKTAPDVIPDISAESIKDKSKANHLAKSIVCLQAIWFCVQVITRLAFGLGISLLELNTSAHAVCALMVYLLWWDKPLDIAEPTILPANDPRIAELCAAMCLNEMAVLIDSNVLYFIISCWLRDHDPTATQMDRRPAFDSSRNPAPVLGVIKLTPKEIVSRDLTHPALTPRADEAQPPTTHESIPSPTRDSGVGGATDNPVFIELESEIEILSFVMVPPMFKNRASNSNAIIEAEISHDFWELYKLSTRSTEILFTLGSTAKLVACLQTWPFNDDDPDLDLKDIERLLDDNSALAARSLRAVYRATLEISDLLGSDKSLQVLAGGVSWAAIIYSAWHLTARNGPFISEQEELLWRICALGLAIPSVCVQAVISVAQTIHPLSELFWYRVALLIVFGCFTPMLIIFMIFCRTYLVVESFFSLPYLPDSAFLLPNWSPYFPHIG
ncbi:hypothetical protein B0T22DRAFT_269790 [Podospora appendiculata]|uniref:Uncharacterized protein n=1 Tax=Podospora appendiculata TaxID=314037 RepID=A0AAE0X3F5_9PEZI|nr:hypothetical protein B0T22DRAFT_269790 [Podospora appendiculata]